MQRTECYSETTLSKATVEAIDEARLQAVISEWTNIMTEQNFSGDIFGVIFVALGSIDAPAYRNAIAHFEAMGLSASVKKTYAWLNFGFLGYAITFRRKS